MNRAKKEREKRLNNLTPNEREEFVNAERIQQEQWEQDCRDFPELMNFMYDSGVDISERRLGVSPLSREARDYIRRRYENG